MKKMRNSIGSFFSYIFIILCIVSLFTLIQNFGLKIFSFKVFAEPLFYVVLIFGLLGLPKILIDHARSLYNEWFGLRYRKRKTIECFTEWWEEFIEREEIFNNVNVVYGHTHFLNYINLQEEEIKKNPEMYDFYLQKLKKRDIPKEKGPTLVNISAWVKDTTVKEPKYKSVMVASFLYIDEKGCEFFGWDWDKRRVFHIPKEAIIIRRKEKDNVIPDQMAEKLAEIGWPKKLVDKWKEPIKL